MTEKETVLNNVVASYSTKECDGCKKPVPTSVKICADCNYALLGLPGQSKAEWIESLNTKVEKEKKHERTPRHGKAAQPTQ